MNKLIVLFTLVFTLSAFSADKVKTITLNVSGMTCESCAGTVEKALKKVGGVKEAKVDLKKKNAVVTVANTTTSASLIKSVSDAGFTAHEGKAVKTEMKKSSKSKDENCTDGCCGGDCDTDKAPAKAKTSDGKKS